MVEEGHTASENSISLAFRDSLQEHIKEEYPR